MFDQAPQNLPTEPEDILAPAENEPAESMPANAPEASSVGTTAAGPTALSAGRLRPAASSGQTQRAPAQMEEEMDHEEMESDVQISPPILNKRNLFIIAVVVLVLLIVSGALWVWRSSSKRTATPVQNITPQAKVEVPESSAPAAELTAPTPFLDTQPVATSSQVVQPLPVSVDSDGDGLTDAQEIQYGTDPQKADTDGDGLTDYEEIFIWHTNPLNPDTDGDAYSDGAEVKNGYNPNGSGKLLNIPSEVPTGTPIK